VRVRVRRAVEGDLDGLSRLAALTFPLACTPQTTAEVIAAYVSSPSTRTPSGDTMLLEGTPADAAVAEAIRLRPTIALERFYVHPDHHGSGTATALMTATLDAARETGARGIWLGVSEDHGRANAFYARHGFEHVGMKRFLIGEVWEDDNVRERAL
jgi:diamine N-acetyltransferase